MTTLIYLFCFAFGATITVVAFSTFKGWLLALGCWLAVLIVPHRKPGSDFQLMRTDHKLRREILRKLRSRS